MKTRLNMIHRAAFSANGDYLYGLDLDDSPIHGVHFESMQDAVSEPSSSYYGWLAQKKRAEKQRLERANRKSPDEIYRLNLVAKGRNIFKEVKEEEAELRKHFRTLDWADERPALEQGIVLLSRYLKCEKGNSLGGDALLKTLEMDEKTLRAHVLLMGVSVYQLPAAVKGRLNFGFNVTKLVRQFTARYLEQGGDLCDLGL